MNTESLLHAEPRQTQAELEELEREGLQVDDVLHELEQTVESVLREHRIGLLRIGAAGRLYLAGEISQILPLDDGAANERPTPTARRRNGPRSSKGVRDCRAGLRRSS